MSDEKVIVALLSTPTVAEAAENLGIKPQTVYNRLRDPGFKSKYASARQIILEENCHRLQSYVSDAIEIIHGVVMNKQAADQVRLNAADALLRNYYRLSELVDMAERVQLLEQELQEVKNEYTQSVE